jgi:hypothetical protein
MLGSLLSACGSPAFSVAAVGPGFERWNLAGLRTVFGTMLTPSVLTSHRTVSHSLVIGSDGCGTCVSVGLYGLAVCLFSLPFGRWGLHCLVPGRNAVVFHHVVVFPQTVSSPWSTPPQAERTRGSASPRSTSWGEESDGSFRNAVGQVRRGHRRPLLLFRRRRACVSPTLCLQARGEHPSVLAPSLVRLALGQNPSWTKLSQFPSPIPHLHPPPVSPPSPSFLPPRVHPQCQPATGPRSLQ